MANGKLYLSGEYAVVDGAAAIISSMYTRSLAAHFTVSGERDPRILVDEDAAPTFDVNDRDRYVKAASYVAARYCAESNRRPTLQSGQHLTVDIISTLVDGNGRKYGLGSSGAVTVAVIEAYLDWCAVDYNSVMVYKLAVLAELLVKDNGSFGDLASASTGRVISYRRPSLSCLEYLSSKMRDSSATFHDLVSAHWDGLEIHSNNALERLVAEKLHVVIGWTGEPASSADFVQRMAAYKSNQNEAYRSFCQRSSEITRQMWSALERYNAEDFVDSYRQQSKNITELSLVTGGYIETEKLANAREIAESIGYAAKPSGAGGGDCLIAMKAVDGVSNAGRESQTFNEAAELTRRWQAAGIMVMTDWKLK
ncbi:phosphomevalonate kinase [Alloscardovia venturai]|uniref:phosphomevalonate kinase n=1 Tax=Alloscardovia venturai TaxID=1769421 RepID=A0ABW2Y7L0_9BIFI